MDLRPPDIETVYPKELDLFTKPRINRAIKKVSYNTLQPKNVLNDTDSITFIIPKTGTNYVWLKRCKLFLRCKITNEDGSAIPPDVKVAPENLALHTFFDQIDVTFNGIRMNDTRPHHPYRALFDILLGYGSDAKTTHLGSMFYATDKANVMDSTADGVNPGFTTRRGWSKGGFFSMTGPIITDAFMVNRMLVNGVKIVIKLSQSDNNFRLHSSDPAGVYKIEFKRAELRVCEVEVDPSIVIAHSQALKVGNAIYPFTKCEISPELLLSGTSNTTCADIFSGKIPSKLVLAFVTQKAFKGDITKNPFTFDHFDLQSLAVRVNNEKINNEDFLMNFTEGSLDAIHAYDELMINTGKQLKDSGNEISRDFFSGGYTIFVFDLEHEMTDESSMFPVKQGAVYVDLVYRTPLPEPVIMIAYGMFKGWYEVTEFKNINIVNPAEESRHDE